MNLGESSSPFYQQRNHSPELLLGSQQQDKESGLAFRKRAKLTHLTDVQVTNRNNDRYDLEVTSHLSTPNPENIDTYSNVTGTTTTSSESPQHLNLDLPSEAIPTSNYIHHIPSQLSPNEKLRQLLIWFAKKELKRRGGRQGRNEITEKVKRKLLERLESSPSIVSWNRQVDVNVTAIDRNPINIENDQLLEKYKKDIKAVEEEIEEWKRLEDKVYENLAIVDDEVKELKSKDYKVNENLDFIQDLEPDQQAFMTQFLKTEPEHEIGDVVSTMDAEVTQFRLNLHTANQFQLTASKVADIQLSKLAKAFHEKTTLVPINIDEKDLDPFQNNAQRLEQERIKNTENLFRLLSKKK